MKATQVSAIKDKLTEKGMAKAVSYSAKLRLKLPLWENSPAVANQASCLSTGQGVWNGALESQVTFLASM